MQGQTRPKTAAARAWSQSSAASPSKRAVSFAPPRAPESAVAPPLVLYGAGCIAIAPASSSLVLSQPEQQRTERQCGSRRAAAHDALMASKNQHLKAHLEGLGVAWQPGADLGHVDAAFDEYAGLRKLCLELARRLAYSARPMSWTEDASTPHLTGNPVGETGDRMLERLRIGTGQEERGDKVGGDLDDDHNSVSIQSDWTAPRHITIAPRGDAILEFANEDVQDADGVLRFRVSSYMLSEISPYFARLFSHHAHNMDPSCSPSLTHQPRTVVLPGGFEARLYSMPEPEPNRYNALSILFHAAHMQTDKVPRTVSFEQFVAVAEVCLRYECTSPLEGFVEHLWLPAWVHMAATILPLLQTLSWIRMSYDS